MIRKKFLKGLAGATIALPFALRALLGETQAQGNAGPKNWTDQRFDWKMVTTWPPNFPVLGEGAQRFADRVEALSGGRLRIKVFGGGELVPALECFDAVRNGAADMASGAAYYWAGKVPAAQFFASIPFGMNAQQVNAWIISGEGWDLWREVYADYGLVPFPGGNTGVQMGGWFNREINTVADLKGLKMRMPGLGGKVLERAGGTPVLLSGGELYTGLERGIIDATEWIGPYHDYKMGFHQIAKYYYAPGWHEPGTMLELLANRDRLEELPPDLQAIVMVTALEINHWVLCEFEAKNAEYLRRIEAESEVEFRNFSPEVLAELRGYTDELLREFTAADPFAQKVYSSYQTFRKEVNLWSGYTEKLFYDRLQL